MRLSLLFAAAILLASASFAQAAPPCPNGQCAAGQCPSCVASCPGCSGSTARGIVRGGLFHRIGEHIQSRRAERQARRDR